MDFADDERSVSTIIGALFAFTIVIFLVIGYQVAIVPAQNEQVEFSHYQAVQQDLQELRTAQINAGSAGDTRSASVQLGTRYPSRVFASNAAPPSGTLRTGSAQNIQSNGPVDLSNVCGIGTTNSLEVYHIVYQPGYNYFSENTNHRIENTVYYLDADGDPIPPLNRTKQVLIRPDSSGSGGTIHLYPIVGSFQASATGSKSVEFVGNATGSKTYSSSPPSIDLPSRLTEAQWDSLLGPDDLIDPNGASDTVTFDPPNAGWTVKCSPVGIGEPPDQSATTAITGGTGGGSGSGASAYNLSWDLSQIETESGVQSCTSGNDTCIYDPSLDSNVPSEISLTVDTESPPTAFVTIDYGTNDSSVVTGFSPSAGTTGGSGTSTTDATISADGTASVLASSSEDFDTFRLIVDRSGPGFPRVVYYDSNDAVIRGIDGDGVINNYTTTQVKGLGPGNTDIDGDGDKDVPYVGNSNSRIKIVDTSNTTTQLNNNQANQGRLGVGAWNDTDSVDNQEVIYRRNSHLHAADENGGEAICRSFAGMSGNCGSKYDSLSVAGVADYTGDSNKEIIFVDDNKNIVYIDEETDSTTDTGVDASTANAVSTPADFDGDGRTEVAVVNNNANIDLVEDSGLDETLDPPVDVNSIPMGALDWTGDNQPEIIYKNNNGNARYYDVATRTQGLVEGNSGIAVVPNGQGIV